MPRPLRTCGTCLAGTYVRWPGRDTRRMPVIALPDAAVVAERQLEHASACCPRWQRRLSTKPSSRRISAMRELDVRARALDQLLARADAVADASEEISDGIGHRHG